MMDDWGISVEKFNLNGDCPKMNRYEYQWNLSNSKYLDVCQLIQSTINVLNINREWCSINRGGAFATGKLLYALLESYNDASCTANDIWHVPVSYFNEQNPDEQHTWFLEWKRCLYGVVILSNESNPPLYTTKHNHKYYKCEVIGGGAFSKPVNLNLIDYDLSNNQVNELPQAVISKSKTDISFDPNLKHNIGFAISPLRTFWCSDLKGLASYLGHKGASAKYPCVNCLASKQENICKSPIPSNKQWKSRTMESFQQCAIAALSKQSNQHDYSIKRFPILPVGCANLCLPTLHTNLGPLFNIIKVVVAKIQNNNEDYQQMKDYNAKYQKLMELKNDLSNHQTSLNFLQESENLGKCL